MHRKHYFWAVLLSLLGIVFYDVAVMVPEDLLSSFVPRWWEGAKALVVGILLGSCFRLEKIKKYLLRFVLGGESFLRVGFGVLGYGLIGIGVVGALVVYAQHQNFEMALVPLNASVVGIAVSAIHLVLNWKGNEI